MSKEPAPPPGGGGGGSAARAPPEDQEDAEGEEGGERLPLSASLPPPPAPRSDRTPGSPVAAAPSAYRPSGPGLGVSAEGPAAPSALSPEARRLRLRGRGCFWAACSGSMARRGVGRWPGARGTRWVGHRARPLLPGEQFLSGVRRHRRRHLPGFENGGRAAPSQSGGSGRLLGNVKSRPFGA